MRSRQYSVHRLYPRWVRSPPHSPGSPLTFASRSTYTDIITRDNCATTLYCDPTAFTCTPTLDLLSACSSDRECTSVNCSPQNVCAAPPATPLSPGTWAYALVGLALIGTMVGTVGMLLVIDRKQKVRRRRERAEAWNEQRELRAAILGSSSVV